MAGFFDKGSAITGIDRRGLEVEPGFLEAFQSGFRAVRNKGTSLSEFRELSRAYDDRVDEIERATGKRLANPFGVVDFVRKGAAPADFFFAMNNRVNEFEKQAEELRGQLPEEKRDSIISKQLMQDRIKARAHSIAVDQTDILQRAGLSGWLGNLAGEMAGFFTDPALLATLPLGIPSLTGRTILQSMGRVALNEAVIAGVSETAIQLKAQSYQKRLGFEDAGLKRGLTNVAIATGGGFAFGGLIGAGARVLQLRGGKKVLEEEIAKRVVDVDRMNSGELADNLQILPGQNRDLDALSYALNRDQNLQRDNPFLEPEVNTASIKEHDARTHKADQAAEVAELPKIPDSPVQGLSARAVIEGADNIDGPQTELINPQEVNIDAPRFQFKQVEGPVLIIDEVLEAKKNSLAFAKEKLNIKLRERETSTGSDLVLIEEQIKGQRNLIERFKKVVAEHEPARVKPQEEGLTGRLKGVEDWDHTKAGVLIVFEQADGKRFVADGHQRVALAKRIMAKDPKRNLRVAAIVRREVDGFTPDDVMVEAAMKNIAETDVPSKQMMIDAAKVLRIRPQELDELLKTLPRSSRMVKIARGLTEISDESFSSVINRKVAPNHAALVAKLVPGDRGLQDAIIRLLINQGALGKTDLEVEAIIRQAREIGTTKITQETLFGAEEFQESLFSERAKILKNTVQTLRRDRKTFQSLIRNKGNIEKAGNKLATDVNTRIAQENAVALELLLKLANKKGRLSDALTEAARQGKTEGRFGRATSQFVDSVREAVGRGDFEGITERGHGRNLQSEAQNRADVADRTATRDAADLKPYDDPQTGDVYDQQARLFDDQVAQAAEAPELGEIAIPVRQVFDEAEGVSRAETRTLNEMAEEIADDEQFVTGLAGCVRQ